jgi:putative PIN family toxin of toxin-antitoxin system
MKYLLDTNILVSMFLLPNSISSKAYDKAVTPPHNAVVCSYSIDELKRVFNKKFPNRLKELGNFIASLSSSVEFIETPYDVEYEAEKAIRDKNDRPILRSAIFHKIDIIITGDKDFLESGISSPKIITPVQFLEFNNQN